MNRERMKKALALVLVVLLGINSVGLYLLHRELTSLKYQLSGMASSLRANIDSLNYEIGNRYGYLEELIRKDQSMLSDSSVSCRLKADKIRVEMQAVSKTLSGGEELFARVYAGDRMYEAPVSQDGLAVIETGMAEYIRPVFVIKSTDGIRQEAMDEIYTGSLFEAGIETRWGEDSLGVITRNADEQRWGLTAWIFARNEGLPFVPDEVTSAEFVVKNSGIRESSDGPAEVAAVEVAGADGEFLFSENAGDRIPAKAIQGVKGESVGYWADLSGYRDRKDGIRYDVYFCLTTADGVRFQTPYDAVASFSTDENSWSDMTTNGGILAPVYR